MKVDAHVDEAVKRMAAAGYHFRKLENAPWISAVESKLELSLPAFYRSLVTRYSFPLIELESVEFFANFGNGSEYDLMYAVFRDPFMSPWLAEHKLIHIGHPYIGNYDPICFDLRSTSRSKEPPLVRVDHEDILLDRPTVRIFPFASSFEAVFRPENHGT